MRHRTVALSALLGVLLLQSPVRPAPRVVDRVVAAVNGRAVCVSEVRRRARLQHTTLSLEEWTKAEASILQAVLEELIEERLVVDDASSNGLSVTPEEVDRSIDTFALATRQSTSEVLAEAKRLGVSEQGYRDEMWRRLLTSKWVEAVVRPRVTAATSLEAARKKRIEELRGAAVVERIP